MLQREFDDAVRACPSCGRDLAQQNGILLCPEHGAFFSYGPHLLVRAPNGEHEPQQVPMPWEPDLSRRAH